MFIGYKVLVTTEFWRTLFLRQRQMIGNSNSQKWKTSWKEHFESFDNSKYFLISPKLGVGQACASLAPETPAAYERARHAGKGLFGRKLENIRKKSVLLQANDLQNWSSNLRSYKMFVFHWSSWVFYMAMDPNPHAISRHTHFNLSKF